MKIRWRKGDYYRFRAFAKAVGESMENVMPRLWEDMVNSLRLMFTRRFYENNWPKKKRSFIPEYGNYTLQRGYQFQRDGTPIMTGSQLYPSLTVPDHALQVLHIYRQRLEFGTRFRWAKLLHTGGAISRRRMSPAYGPIPPITHGRQKRSLSWRDDWGTRQPPWNSGIRVRQTYDSMAYYPPRPFMARPTSEEQKVLDGSLAKSFDRNFKSFIYRSMGVRG